MYRLSRTYEREGIGGARPRRDPKIRLLNDAEFARGIQPLAGLACNRYFDPEKSPTGNREVVATVSVCGGDLQFRVSPDPSEIPGKEDGSANEKEA